MLLDALIVEDINTDNKASSGEGCGGTPSSENGADRSPCPM